MKISTAQLIDASSEEHLWVQSYDRQLEGVFAIQTEVAQKLNQSTAGRPVALLQSLKKV